MLCEKEIECKECAMFDSNYEGTIIDDRDKIIIDGMERIWIHKCKHKFCKCNKYGNISINPKMVKAGDDIGDPIYASKNPIFFMAFWRQ